MSRVEITEECLSLGPFFNENEAAGIRDILLAQKISSDLFETDIVVHKDYWMIIPPQEGETAAKKLLVELQSSDIESYIIADGEYRYGITLGVFGDEQNTKRYQQKLIAQGFGVEVKVIPRKQVAYWLEIKKQNAAELPASFVQDIDMGSDIYPVVMEDVVCGSPRRVDKASPNSV